MEIFRRRNRDRIQNIHTESSIDVPSGGPASPQIVDEGNELFEDFMRTRIDKDVPILRSLVEENPPTRPKTNDIGQAAARLRELATNFSQTPARQEVREVAMEISSDITGEELSYLLLTMLTNSDNIEEGIVVVFFFCFDLVVRFVSSGLRPYMAIIGVCKTAMLQALGPKVQERGGWSRSIKSAAGGSLVVGAVVTGMMVVARVGLKTMFNV